MNAENMDSYRCKYSFFNRWGSQAIFVCSALFIHVSGSFEIYPGLSLPCSFSTSYPSFKRKFALQVSSAPSYEREALAKLKVAELKEMLTQIPANERKGSSKLKKSELIDFLHEYHYNNGGDRLVVEDGCSGENVAMELKASSRVTIDAGKIIDDQPKLKNPKIRSMPSLAKTTRDANTQSIIDEFNEFILNRYPMFNPDEYENGVVPMFSGVGVEDVRSDCHPLLKPYKGITSDVDVVFVGTASCIPSLTRGVSCTALRLNWNRDGRAVSRKSSAKSKEKVGGIWIFDAGECTQLQIQNVPSIKLSKVTKIFITHCHGDHSFGLPGLLCLMGQAAVEKNRNDKESQIIDIYAPQGLRLWLRVAIRYSQSRICPKYRVHELMDVPMAPEWRQSKFGRYFYQKQSNKSDWRSAIIKTMRNTKSDFGNWINYCSEEETDDFLPADQNFGEVPGGRQIYPDYKHPKSIEGAPVYDIINDEEVTVTAAPMSHGVPCVGYVVEEQPRSGKINPELVQPVVMRNFDELKANGYRHPMKILSEIKNLDLGESFCFPDGTELFRDDVVEGDKPGRKIVICGDTCDSRALENLAQNADLLVHECTNAFLQGIDRQTTMKAVNVDAITHGHSTPQIAGNFAKKIGAKNLVLNHFSSRYRGDQDLESIKIMTRIERQAIDSSGLNEEHVASSWDFMVLPIPAKTSNKS